MIATRPLLIAAASIGVAASAFAPHSVSVPFCSSYQRSKRYHPMAKPTVNFHSIPPSESEEAGSMRRKFIERISICGWLMAISSFIVANYFGGPWPSSLLHVPRRAWILIHAFSGMIFSGGIIISSLVEWLVVQSRVPSVVSFWFETVSGIDRAVVLPALSGSIVSGVAQSAIDYGVNLRFAPRHVKSTIHTLSLFAIWWAATDLTTQKATRRSVPSWYEENKNEVKAANVPALLQFRRQSNVVSCIFVAVLYILMALKPGYH